MTHSDAGQPLSRIDISPLAGILLVLVIMVVVGHPIQTYAVRLDFLYPRADDRAYADRNLLVLDGEGQIFWNGLPIDRDELDELLAMNRTFDVQPELHFKPDADANYLAVLDMMAAIKRAGVTRCMLIDTARFAGRADGKWPGDDIAM